VVLITLSSPDGHLILQARHSQITEFVDRSLAVVPLGDEGQNLDIDSLVNQLLS
jgi:hypothetical protein